MVERERPQPAQAFPTYLAILDQWRRLPFRDPGLPAELLAPDWSAPRAVAVFDRLVAALEEPALDPARAHWSPS